MILRHGNMFDHIDEASVIVVTTNSTITSHGELVMGKGAARDAARIFPGLPARFGQRIAGLQWALNSPDYKLATIWSPDFYPRYIFGALQVKRHFSDAAKLSIISESLTNLYYYAKGTQHSSPESTIFVNFPGIGNGRLGNARDDIMRMLKKLPDNVTVWEK